MHFSIQSNLCTTPPPKGLGKSGLNSEEVPIARFGSMKNVTHYMGLKFAPPSFLLVVSFVTEVVARTGLTVCPTTKQIHAGVSDECSQSCQLL